MDDANQLPSPHGDELFLLAKIAEMKAEGADMQNALTILEVKPDEEVE